MVEHVDRWLETLGLGKYAALFAENEITVEELPDLSDDELKELGLPIGPRKRILKAAGMLVEAAPSEKLAASLSAPLTSSQAERRQLTVMFVDLVGSTALAERLDPEEMGAVLRAYQNAVAGEILRLEGHVAKFMGDGVLAYFGWPVAHEDEAERAVRAGLAIVAAVGRLSAGDVPLACRIGIATGLVVVGELIGEGAAQEQTVVGETPNLAARLQGVAEPSQVVITETTRQLVGAAFELTPLAAQTLKGLSLPVTPFAALGERAAGSRFEARSGSGFLPMVGRDQELALLLERWDQAKRSEGQGVLLVGEAGIGKSRITRALLDAVRAEPHVRVRFQCSPYHADSAFWPVIQQLTRAAAFADRDTAEQRLDKLEAVLARAGDTSAAPLLADLLGLDGTARYGALELTPQAQRTRTLRALIDQILGLARQQPVLLVLEDAHWIDPSTLELVEQALDRGATAPVLLLLTSRPENQPALAGHPHVTRLTLNRLGRAGVEAIVERLSSGTVLPVEVIDTIITRTDGVPLFVEELTKAVLESGDASVPASLHDSLMARLDRIPEVKEVAQIGAVIGREFEHAALTAIADRSPEALDGALDRLAAAELVFRRGTPPEAHYTFKHALVRDAAYHSLLNERRRGLHRCFADHLERADPVEPALLAHHREGANQPAEALRWYRDAGTSAFERSANAEAMGHFRAALRVLAGVPDLPDARTQELDLLLALGRATTAAKSYAAEEADDAYRRAGSLCDSTTDADRQLQLLVGEFLLHANRGRHREAAQVADAMLALGVERNFVEAELLGLRTSGMCAHWAGQVRQTRTQFERLISLCEGRDVSTLGMRYGYDPYIGGMAFYSHSLAVSGYLDQAAKVGRRTMQLAQQIDHLHSRGLGGVGCCFGARVGRRYHELLEWSQATRELAEEQGFELIQALATMLEASARVSLGEDAESANSLALSGFTAWEATGTVLVRPLYLLVLAECAVAAGDDKAAAQRLTEALADSERPGDRLHVAEVHRQIAVLAVQRGDPQAAERYLETALEISRQQEARLWELCATRDLARLWAERGERQRALDLLAPAYDWFTEGFDTPDLIEAKALLDELR